MSNKNLLNEAQIRQFMKLAKLEPLTPGFVNGLTERGNELEEDADGEEDLEESAGAKEDLEERRQTRPPGGGPFGGGTSHGRSSEPMPGDDALMREIDDEELESELGATEDELGGEDREADEEEGEIEDLEAADEEGTGAEKMISVSDLLAALEAAIEEVTGEEVETSIDADLEGEDEFAPEGEEVVADEEELEEASWTALAEAETEKEGEEREKLKWEKGRKPPKKGETGGRPTPRRSRPQGMTISGSPVGEGQDTNDLIEQITRRVAARILKSALAKK